MEELFIIKIRIHPLLLTVVQQINFTQAVEQILFNLYMMKLSKEII